MPSNKPKIGITMGDPAGVGPELCLKLIENQNVLSQCTPILFGDAEVLVAVANTCNLNCPQNVISIDSGADLDCDEATIVDLASASIGQFEPGIVNQLTGQASFSYINAAIDFALAGSIDAISTGPINKEAWQAAGIQYPGHTELFAERGGSERYCMMMAAMTFSCSLVTTHVGYHEVPGLLSSERILEVIELSYAALNRIHGRASKLVCLGLNPHAGEGGLFGNREEEEIIAPAVAAARNLGIDITDPLPPDTAFLPKWRAQADGYICMYHDQGLIPFKAFNFDQGVNVTLGLPSLIRTSVDHGTALDIAWKNIASESSLISSVELAVKLVAS